MERAKGSYLNHASQLKRQISLRRVTKTSAQIFWNRKPEKKFINRKYLTLVLNREVGNEIYNQLLFTFIKFYRIFHYCQKPTWKFLISCALAKAVIQIFFGKNTKRSSMVEYNFAKIHFDWHQIYKTCTTPWMFPGLFGIFSDQRFGLSIRFCPCLFPGGPESNRSV